MKLKAQRVPAAAVLVQAVTSVDSVFENHKAITLGKRSNSLLPPAFNISPRNIYIATTIDAKLCNFDKTLLVIFFFS